MTGAHLTALFVAAGFWTIDSVSAPAQKKAYRNIRFAHKAWKIPLGAAALLTASQAAASGGSADG
jgi:hypothetical protein